MNLTNPLKDTIFKRFFPALFSASGDEEKQGNDNNKLIIPSMKKYQEISLCIQKSNKVSADMLSRKTALQNTIAELDERRIEQLSYEAMQGDTENEYGYTVEEMLEGILAAQQELSDIEAVHKNIMANKQEQESERNEVHNQCKQELGQYLNTRFSALATHYHGLVPEISETVLQIQAVQDLMIQLHTGNSNGFDGDIRLPTIEHGNGNTLTPFLESSSVRYTSESNERKNQILIELTAAGYPVLR